MISHHDIDMLEDYMFDGIISLIWKKGMKKNYRRNLPFRS